MRFYEAEMPEKVITEFGEFRYYKNAKKLQMSKPKWKNIEGEICQGKTVTVDVSHLKGNKELKALLNLVLKDIDE